MRPWLHISKYAALINPCATFPFAQFYFINALFAVGMVLGLMGLTIFLRWEYSLFGDPIGPLIFAVMFLFGDLVQKLLRRIADIKASVPNGEDFRSRIWKF